MKYMRGPVNMVGSFHLERNGGNIMTDENRTTMRVILCKPGEIAEVIEMEDSLKAMQETVGGLIEEYQKILREKRKASSSAA